MKRNDLVGIAVGLVGLAYGLYSQYKMAKVVDKLDEAIDSIDNKTPVEVSEDIVNSAVKQAVDREVSSLAHKAALAASVEISSNMRKEVKEAVSTKFDDLSAAVSDEIANQVSRIDNDALAKRISKKAEEKLLDKLDGSLDDVLDNYNRELKNVGKIYSSIADTMSRHSEPKAMYFK